MKMNAVLGLIGIIFCACGSKDDKKSAAQAATEQPNEEEQGPPDEPVKIASMTVASDDDRPDCGDDNDGQMVYSLESKTLFYCDDKEWTEVEGYINNVNHIVVTEDVAAGATCPLGGKIIRIGDDKDGDGALSTEEEISTVNQCLSAAGASLDPQAFEMYQQKRAGVVMILTVCGGNTSQGSGYRCSETEICTAHHVISCQDNSQPTSVRGYYLKSANDSDVYFPGNLLFNVDSSALAVPATLATAEIAYVDIGKIQLNATDFDGKNIPILANTTSRPSANCLDNSNDPTCVPYPQTFTKVINMGFPLSLLELYSDTGFVNTNNASCDFNAGTGMCDRRWDFSSTNDSDHGSSGSPVISLDTGEVLGVLVSGTEQENANYSWSIGAWRFGDAFP